MTKMKKVGLWIVGILLLSVLGNIFAPPTQEETKPTQEEVVVKNVKLEAHTICKMLVEKALAQYVDVDFPLGNRKIFEKGNQRYIVKDYVLFLDNNVKTKANWHCDIHFKGGEDTMDTNNWELLKFELLRD